MEKVFELNPGELDKVAGGVNSIGGETILGTIVNIFKDPRPKAKVNLDSGERLTCDIDVRLWKQSDPGVLTPGVRVEVLKRPSLYVVMNIVE